MTFIQFFIKKCYLFSSINTFCNRYDIASNDLQPLNHDFQVKIKESFFITLHNLNRNNNTFTTIEN